MLLGRPTNKPEVCNKEKDLTQSKVSKEERLTVIKCLLRIRRCDITDTIEQNVDVTYW